MGAASPTSCGLNRVLEPREVVARAAVEVTSASAALMLSNSAIMDFGSVTLEPGRTWAVESNTFIMQTKETQRGNVICFVTDTLMTD